MGGGPAEQELVVGEFTGQVTAQQVGVHEAGLALPIVLVVEHMDDVHVLEGVEFFAVGDLAGGLVAVEEVRLALGVGFEALPELPEGGDADAAGDHHDRQVGGHRRAGEDPERAVEQQPVAGLGVL